MQKAQGALEYLIIIAAVLVISGVVVLLVSGSIGGQKTSFLYNSCRQAATECRITKLADPNIVCEACVDACTDPTSDKEIFPGAIECCQLGQSSSIYEGATGCEIEPFCGNGVCDPGEDSTNCAVDCPAAPNQPPTANAGSDQSAVITTLASFDVISPGEAAVANKYTPTIHDKWIAWTDSNADLFVYNINSGVKKQIATGTANSGMRADIYGNKIVWADRRSGSDQVYMYDLITNTETHLTTGAETQTYPQIYEDTIALIYGGYSDTGKIFNLSDVTLPINVGSATTGVTTINPTGNSYDPIHSIDLYEDLLAFSYYQASSNQHWRFRLGSYDLSTGVVSTNLAYAIYLSLYQNKAVYSVFTLRSIYQQSLPAGTASLITGDSVYASSENRPGIYGSIVVWTNDNNNDDIALEDTSTSKEILLTNNIHVQKSPSIYGDKIVFVNDSNEILLTTIPTPRARVVFNGIATDPDGTIVSYDWTFGDGNIGSGQTVTHDYTTAGTYTVTLTVTDDDGATAADTATITVTG